MSKFLLSTFGMLEEVTATHATVVEEFVQHELKYTSAYVSIRQHTSAYVSRRQQTSAYVSIRQHTSAYVSIRSVEEFVQHELKRDMTLL
jgi:hypothetical protein